eukprot:TRINITY_DN1091_c0_g1_i1.p2 TRINITY_DN1091_c0_g1~~TRINITY_DN1091_c0_g1_i1.p2  ORF type:complete len:233 (+),score=48.79 TRINITY_DN1091_c0_g1_i1:75-773(+)
MSELVHRRGAPHGGDVAGREGPVEVVPAAATGVDDGILSTVWKRITVLIGLMLLQSMSQFILESFQKLVSDHVIVPLFLTMLVGAGGNAGNQAAVASITGLATGQYTTKMYRRVLAREFVIGVLCATALSAAAMARIHLLYSPAEQVEAFGEDYMLRALLGITLSLFLIVMSSMAIGGALPFLFEGVGLDREHAAPCIQVIMDIMGVYITCQICTYLLVESRAMPIIPLSFF